MSPLTKWAWPALAVAGSALAQSSCSTSGTATVQNGGDATAIASCTTYSGSIAIATSVASDLSFDGNLKEINGDFILQANDQIKRVSAGSLESISGALTVSDVSQLASLTMAKLTSVGSLTLKNLANLRALGFDAQITKASILDIENTQLQNLNGINLNMARSILITNNPAVSNISMDLTNVTGALVLTSNNDDVAVSLPKLQTAQNITFESVASLNIPAFTKTTGGDFLVIDSDLQTLSAPNLTNVAQALSIRQCNNLNNVSFPLLTDVGAAFQIANSTQLKTIDGFPKLKNIGAAFDVSGAFTNISTPSIDFVKGVFNLQTTGDIGNTCANFYDPLKNKGKLGPTNRYVCRGNLTQANSAGVTPSGTSAPKPTGNAASSMTVQNAYLGAAGLAVFMLV